MPKVLSSPKLPPTRGGGRRNFRLSPLEIGVAILVAMGGIYLLYILLSGLFSGGDRVVENAGVPADLNPARLDKVLSAAEAAQRRLSQLDKRLIELDKRLTKAASGEAPPSGKGGGDPKLAARLAALEKQVAALSAAPAGKGGKPGKADPKLAGQVQGLEKQLKEMEQANQKLSAQVEKLAKAAPVDPKLAAQVKGLEKQVAALSKAKPVAKTDDNMRKRLEELEKQMVLLAQQPAKGAAKGAAVVPPQLVQRVVGQGEVLSGVTTTLGKMEREQERREKKLEQRLRGLEKRLSSGGKAVAADDKRLAALEKQVASLAAAKPGVASPAEAKLNQRVAELDKRLSALAKADAKGDRSDAQRVAALEKELARVRKEAAAARQADPKLAARLKALEKKLAVDDRQEQQVDRRLDQLEKKVASVASRPAPRPVASAPRRAVRPATPSVPQLVRITHVVRPGQTLYGLARDYDTTLNQIKAWNPKLAQRNKILIGEKLVIYVKK
ncbi:MAG: LysM peptidoglycan-binding domain-containing protein [Desulfarculaceae bacterium]|nr:LysM peptidoglycan-binding domain-containing protein [Desulfarculaceae bacterium]